ncbi:hypothetical protein GCM10009077_12260 [Roseibium denhamense]
MPEAGKYLIGGDQAHKGCENQCGERNEIEPDPAPDEQSEDRSEQAKQRNLIEGQ